MNDTKKMEWILRVGVAGEFIGHGLLAIYGKQDWVGWIARVVHVENSMATTLLLLIGMLDLIVALIVFIKPVGPVLLWATFCGLGTALLRPIFGLGWLEFFTRSANWAAPLSLYYVLRENKRIKST